MAQRGGTASGRKVRVVLGGQRATVRRIIEPLSWKTASDRFLERRLTSSEGIILGLNGNSRGSSKMILRSVSTGAFIIVRVVKTLLGRKRQRGKVWWRIGHYVLTERDEKKQKWKI